MVKFFYKTNHYLKPEIEKVEIDKASSKHVWFGEHKVERHTGNVCYWSTWEAAHQHLMETTAAKVQRAYDHMQKLKDFYKEVERLKP